MNSVEIALFLIVTTLSIVNTMLAILLIWKAKKMIEKCRKTRQLD